MTRTSADAFQASRRGMVEQQIRARGVRDARVLQAMLDIPREKFVPESERECAYDDRALPLGLGQTISQPYMVAYMTELLHVAAESKVLEVGTGSGYQTAVLAHLAKTVHSIERLEELRRGAERTLLGLGFSNVYLHDGDGSLGLPAFAPFDQIIVTAGAPRVPGPLVDQLVDRGRLVIPVGGPSDQTVVLVVREGPRTVETPMLACRFVKLIGQHAWTPEA